MLKGEVRLTVRRVVAPTLLATAVVATVLVPPAHAGDVSDSSDALANLILRRSDIPAAPRGTVRASRAFVALDVGACLDSAARFVEPLGGREGVGKSFDTSSWSPSGLSNSYTVTATEYPTARAASRIVSWLISHRNLCPPQVDFPPEQHVSGSAQQATSVSGTPRRPIVNSSIQFHLTSTVPGYEFEMYGSELIAVTFTGRYVISVAAGVSADTAMGSHVSRAHRNWLARQLKRVILRLHGALPAGHRTLRDASHSPGLPGSRLKWARTG